MLDSLVKGQRFNISNYLNELKQIRIEVIYQLNDNYELNNSIIDISAFCLTDEKKFLNELYLVGEKNNKTPCNGVYFHRAKKQGQVYNFLLDFTKLNPLIKKINLVLSMNNHSIENPDYNKIFKSLEVRIIG